MPAPAQIGDNSPLVLRQDDGAVAIITLNRPAARNSLSRAMLSALSARLEEVAAENGIRAVVLAANVSQTLPAYCRIVHSAQNFHRVYNDLKQGESSLNPIERFVFSLVLAGSKANAQTGRS